MKLSLVAVGIALFSASSAHAGTVFQCAANSVNRGGVRVNVIHSERNGYRANLIFGTTVSGQMYRVQPTTDGFKGDSQGLPMELHISKTPAQNKYIDGFAASLEVTYIDVRRPSGKASLTTKTSQQFVCGKQIRPYNE